MLFTRRPLAPTSMSRTPEQVDPRSVRVNYLNLVASYLNAANQLNLAVGHEIIP